MRADSAPRWWCWHPLIISTSVPVSLLAEPHGMPFKGLRAMQIANSSSGERPRADPHNFVGLTQGLEGVALGNLIGVQHALG